MCSRPASPTFLAQGINFMEDNFFTDQGWERDGFRMVRHITFTAHFISITSTSPQIIRHLISETGEPVLDWHWLQRANTRGLTWRILALAAALRTPFGPHAMPLSSCQLNRHFLYSHSSPLPSKCGCKPHSSSFCRNLPPLYHPVFSPIPVILLCPPGLLSHGSPLSTSHLVLSSLPLLDLWWPPYLQLHCCDATSGL